MSDDMIRALAERGGVIGYAEDAVINIMGGNWRRLLEHALSLA